METNKKNDNEPKKSWLEQNLWWVALGIAIFMLRMCKELAR